MNKKREYNKYFLDLFEKTEYKKVNVDNALNQAMYQFPNAKDIDLENALNSAGIKTYYDQSHKFFSCIMARKYWRISKKIMIQPLKTQPDYGEGGIQKRIEELEDKIKQAKHTGLFVDVIHDEKEKFKKLLNDEIDIEITKLEKKLKKDLASKGFKVISCDLKIGNFRGHPYITSAKMILEFKSNHNKLLSYLQETYSDKFKLKNVDKDKNIMTLNIR